MLKLVEFNKHELLFLYQYYTENNLADLAISIERESDMKVRSFYPYTHYVNGVEQNFLSITLVAEIQDYYAEGKSKCKTFHIDVMEGHGLLILGNFCATEIDKESLTYMLKGVPEL